MTKRFAIHPGMVRSTSDFQKHYVSGGSLIDLYGLDFRECYIVGRTPGEIVDPSLLPLFPLDSGDYKGHLEQIKVVHFCEYERARKLYVYHESGASPHRHMREKCMSQFMRTIQKYERQWPDFRAAYDRRNSK